MSRPLIFLVRGFLSWGLFLSPFLLLADWEDNHWDHPYGYHNDYFSNNYYYVDPDYANPDPYYMSYYNPYYDPRAY